MTKTAGAYWAFRVEYWRDSYYVGRYVGRKYRKFRTKEAAFTFVRDKYDDGYDTAVFGPGLNPDGDTGLA